MLDKSKDCGGSALIPVLNISLYFRSEPRQHKRLQQSNKNKNNNNNNNKNNNNNNIENNNNNNNGSLKASNELLLATTKPNMNS